MAKPDDEEERLRSAALQNAHSILLARRRAEEELVRANAALEAKTAELAHSLALIRATLESTTNGILVTDATGRVTSVNENFARMWNLERAQVAQESHDDLLRATSLRFDDPAAFLANIDEVYRDAPPESFHVLELADGRTIERFSRIQYVEGDAVGRVWSFRDVTSHRTAEEAVRKQAEWLRVTLASIGDAVITTDASACVTSMNRVAVEMTGWSDEEARGRPLEEVFRISSEDSDDPIENPAARALREGRIVGLANHAILIARGGETRAIDDSAAPIQDDKGVVIGAVLVFRDITEQRRRQDELARSEQELRESDRKKDEFLAMLAHELRNPLAPISNAAQVVRALPSRSTELDWAMDVIERQIHQMTRLVDDLMDISRITRGRIELRTQRVDVATLVEMAVESCRPLLEDRRHELKVVAAGSAIPLDVDPTRLTQVLLNLLANAAKYMDPGGRIEVLARRVGDRAQITVKDHGIGIAPEMLAGIFDMFSQEESSLERSRGGLGLGLTLAKRLVELHGGTIVASSEGKGRGSTFTVSLPIASKAAPERPAEPRKSAVPAASQRVLVADDNGDAAESLARLLTLLGHEVVTAGDGLAALEALPGFRPGLVLLDLGMPRLDGYETARRMRLLEEGRGAFIVALTGWGQEEDRRRSRDAGFDEHLTKPVEVGALQELLVRARAASPVREGTA
jgi:PAS domain S-box-containing protein